MLGKPNAWKIASALLGLTLIFASFSLAYWVYPGSTSGTSIGTIGGPIPIDPIPIDPQPPVARAGADKTVKTNEKFTLDGSASTDPDNDITEYKWQVNWYWGYGTGKDGKPTIVKVPTYETGKTITYSYLNPGTYEIQLT